MKKLALVISSIIILAMLTPAVFAATGDELLKSADVYLTFEDGIKDDNGKYTILSDGNTPIVGGRFGSGVNFQGGVNFLTVDGWKFGTDSFTFATWIFCHEQGSDPAIAGSKWWDSGSNIGWVLSARDNDWKYNANSETGSRTDCEYSYSSSPLSDVNGVWYHIAIVVDRANEVYNLYINGVAQNEIDFSGNGHTGETYDDEGNSYTFNIGEDGSGIYNSNCTFNYDYDEVAAFKRALTADEIAAIYAYEPTAAPAPMAETPETEAPAAETLVETPVAVAPQTGDVIILSAIASVATLGIALLSKKHR